MEIVNVLMNGTFGEGLKHGIPILIGILIATPHITKKVEEEYRRKWKSEQAAEREAKENERVIWRAEDKPFTQADFEAWKASKKEKP